MRRRARDSHRESAQGAAADLARLDDEYAELIALLDSEAAMRRAVKLVPGAVGVDAAFVGTPGRRDSMTLDHMAGCRTEAMRSLVVQRGRGLGGQVLALRRPVWVRDYVVDTGITHDYDRPVSTEGLRGMVAVPIQHGDRLLGVLYGACREPTAFGDAGAAAMVDSARRVALSVTVAERARHAAEVAVHEERRRLAMSLHDTVGAMLFAISAGVRNLGTDASVSQEVRTRLADIECRAQEAAATLRESLRALSASPDELALGVALRADCRGFEERTGVPARLVTVSEVPVLDGPRARALVDAAREALLNVEKHAGARSVVVSVFGARGGVAVAVADDGVGLGEAADDGKGIGVGAAAERLGRVGGYLTLATNEDGGTTMKAWVPC